MKRSISGSSVIITGASAGIGLALARLLATQGAKLTLAARRMDRLEQLAKEIPGSHLLIQADVSRPADCQKIINAAAERFGRIDTLVANAGFGEGRPMLNTTAQQIEDIFKTNLLGTTECIKHLLPLMIKQPIQQGYRGQIMIVSSAAARRGLPWLGPYSATKAAQLSIAEALRVEMKQHNIAVTTVHPVGTKTEFFEVAQQRGEKNLAREVTSPKRKAMTQTADQVAAAMVRGMIKPKREVWPFWPARWLLSLCTIWPWLGDYAMTHMLKGMNDANP